MSSSRLRKAPSKDTGIFYFEQQPNILYIIVYRNQDELYTIDYNWIDWRYGVVKEYKSWDAKYIYGMIFIKKSVK
jgi:hypothetical protein